MDDTTLVTLAIVWLVCFLVPFREDWIACLRRAR
jgi:hypothetical protein